jgi:hypothetical protein
MKKFIAILIVLAMALVSAHVIADPTENGCEGCPEGDCAFDDPDCILEIPTSATIAGGNGGQTNGNSPPVIKAKWEYDLDVQIEQDVTCGGPCPDCSDHPELYWIHDACCCIPGLQVKPILYGAVKVGYFAIVTDPEGVAHVDHVYADIWHPDGTFKYQIELFPVGFTGDIYDKTIALDIWEHAWDCHSDLIKINDVWAAGLPIIPGSEPPARIAPEDDIYDELNEELAYIFYGEAYIDYCQPGGWYYVGVRAHDGYDAWCPYLFNRFWYIPTAGIDVDFASSGINYGSVPEGIDKWVGGDQDFGTPAKPTIRNIGNGPVKLYVYQDDMGFGKTAGVWNVKFDARLSANGQVRKYDPEQMDMIDIYGDPEDPLNYYPGVYIPGVLPLCTEEKLDFSIHVYKGFPGYTYTGIMELCAFLDMDSFEWPAPSVYQDTAPIGVPNPYNGPETPGPQ